MHKIPVHVPFSTLNFRFQLETISSSEESVYCQTLLSLVNEMFDRFADTKLRNSEKQVNRTFDILEPTF
jgi:hypothetical protein